MERVAAMVGRPHGAAGEEFNRKFANLDRHRHFTGTTLPRIHAGAGEAGVLAGYGGVDCPVDGTIRPSISGLSSHCAAPSLCTIPRMETPPCC
jgi:hypothetical protein